MEARKLLEYYYNLILFRPEYPEARKTDHVVTDERRYVPYESIFGGESAAGYEVYIGNAETEQLMRSMGEEVEDTKSQTYLCIIRTDKRGYYVKNSFFISPVLFALAKIIKEQNPASLLDLTLINRANDEMDEFLINFDRKLEYRELKEIFNYVVNKLNLSDFIPEFKAVVKERNLYGHNVLDGHLMNLEKILSSGENSEKIEQAAAALRRVLKKASPLEEDYSALRLREMTSPEKNPSGMWPGHEKITLKEQLILNQLMHSSDKAFAFQRMIYKKEQAMRILPEFMTAQLIERASAMVRYAKPDDAFTEIPFSENKEYSSSYYLPEDRLLSYSLCLMGKDPGFAQELEQEIEQVMDALRPAQVFEADGKPYMVQRFSSNRDVLSFIRRVCKEQGDGPARQLSQGGLDWEKTRKDFRDALDAVQKKREEIMQEYRTTFGYQDQLEKVSAAGLRLEELKARIESYEASRQFKENELAKRKSLLKEQADAMRALENDMGFFRRWLSFFFKTDEKVLQRQVMAEEHRKSGEQAEEDRRELNLVLNEYHSLKSDYAQLEEEYQARQTALEASAQHIADYREKYGSAFTDDEILQRLIRDNLTLESGVWLTEEYDDLRKALLSKSLAVHRAFLSNSRAFKTDMILFGMVLEGKLKDKDLNAVYISLLRVYAMMVPVLFISTDYEPYFLSVAKKEELGTVLVPEAGRLPLAEFIGALWKFKRIAAFNIGEDHWSFPEVPQIIQRNLSQRILGAKDPQTADVSLADVMNIL